MKGDVHVVRRCFVVLLLTLWACFSSLDRAQSPRDVTLARGRVGAVRIGMSTEEVAALFGPARIKPVDLRLEGSASPALEIRLDDVAAVRPSMTAEIFPPTNDRIWRVRVFDRAFKTADGLGVGSTLAEVRAHHPVLMAVGEGNVVAVVRALDLSFDFGSQWYPSTDLPASATVSSVLVFLPPGEILR